jgi:predicted GNAT family acetyltransferase
MDVRVEHEPGRFVVRQGGAEATLVYERRGDLLDVQHTFTPPALRGRAFAARLTEAAFAYARAEGLRIVPTCSYTRRWLARHPELAALAAAPARPR